LYHQLTPGESAAKSSGFARSYAIPRFGLLVLELLDEEDELDVLAEDEDELDALAEDDEELEALEDEAVLDELVDEEDPLDTLLLDCEPLPETPDPPPQPPRHSAMTAAIQETRTLGEVIMSCFNRQCL
jgi:hypothetical protein